MRPRLRQSLAVLVGAASVIACAKLADLESSNPPEAIGAEPEDASMVVDGTLQTPEGVAISPAELSLGSMKCQETLTGTITITNNGKAPAPFEVSIPKNDTYTLRGATGGVVKGTVAAGDFTLVNVDAKGSSPGLVLADIVVKAGGTIQQINAKVDVRGGWLGVNPALVDFGEVRKDVASSMIPLELHNEGNEQIGVTGFANLTTDFQLSQSTVVVPAGGSVMVDAMMTAGPASPAKEIQITPQASGTLCNAPPTVMLRGTRVNQDVTVGPLTVDLGDFDCGVAPPKQAKIAVTNYSKAATATYEAKLLSAASRFKIIGAASGVIAKAASEQTPAKNEIVIGANPVTTPLGEIDEDLEVKITDPPQSAVTKIVKLHIGAYGAILEVTPASLSGFARNETKAFAIKNVGNAKTCVAYSDVAGNGYFIEADDELRPNVLDDLRVQFAATSRGTYDYAITISRINCAGGSAPICVPPPSPSVSATR